MGRHGCEICRENVPRRRYLVQRRSIGWNVPENGEHLPVALRAVADDEREVLHRQLCNKLLRRYAQDPSLHTVFDEALSKYLPAFGIEHGKDIGLLHAQQCWGRQSA